MINDVRHLTMYAVVIAATCGAWLPSAHANDPVDFSRDIRPILSDKCFFCHGPDANHRKAKLRLDVKEHALGERDGIWPFKAGSLADSEAWFLINHEDPDERMPPAKSNKKLSAREKDLIKRWIEQGAKWQGHWSFERPTTPALPAVKTRGWGKNPIDAFILARLEKAGLSPSPEARREVLIRRVSFDLTGQPPTLVEIDAFVSDQSVNAYEKMVDRFFAKKAFGERMALAWMDAGRYGDSSVFHADGPRTMWPWRNWVIDAYNANMPFDQFTIEQIAGDLIPNATVSQKVASGFHRNHGTTDEGGAIAEEYRVEYVVDRVKTTGSVWLGMSIECAQCHDHKYDPITQKEYYGLFAFFNQTTDPGMQTRKGNQTPVVNVPDPTKAAERLALEKQATDLDGKIAEYEKSIEPAFAKWVTQAAVEAKAGNKPKTPEDMFAHLTFDETKGNQVGDAIEAKRKGKVNGNAIWAPGKHGGALKLNRKNIVEFGNLADFEHTESFSYGCWVNPDDVRSGVPIGKMNEGNAHRGYDLYISNGTVSVHIINSWPGNAIKVTTKAKIKAKQWTHLFATYDGSSKAAGVKIYFNGKEQPWAIEQNGLSATIKTKVPLKIGGRNNSSQYAGLIDDARFYHRALSATEVAALVGSDSLGPILAIDADKRTKQQQQSLRSHYLQAVDKTYSKLAAEKSKLSSRIEGLKKGSVTSMIMGEQPKPRMTYLLMRGHYASPDKSEAIKPDVPKVLPPLAEGLPRNRLGFAKWLTDKKHPLTARVAVNRYWSMLFGTGIVTTVMDLGSQGSWPSHPELLDWLATDFANNGWDIKRTMKQIVMSATYRQTSRNTSILAQRDPENILIGRGARFRLQGEFIRDNALALSGLLVDRAGGPSVKPYQPPGLWNEVALTGNVRFVQDHGENLYRKSMYIYWKRSSPHPGMMILDAPTRELCVVQRPRTNTPLAALYTLNDTQFVEASRFLAQRMMLEGGDTPAERAAFAYRLATSRRPSPAAIKTLVSLYETELETFKKDEAKAKELLAVGEAKRDESLNMVEHAAWTNVAGVILNMDATLTRY